MWNRRLKATIERLLLHAGPASLARRLRAGRALILAYHNVVPSTSSDVGDRPLHLQVDEFRRQLDAVQENFDVVALEEVAQRDPGRPCVVITFDDAYRGALELGGPELAARGLPSTVFVAPAFLGGGSFWWDRIAADPQGDLDTELREFVLTKLAGDDARTRQWAQDEGRTPVDLPSAWTCPDRAELLAMAEKWGMKLGSHTWGHPNLQALRDEMLHDELRLSLEWIEALPEPLRCRWLSYPYGLFDARARSAARQLGYEGAVAIRGGWVRGDADEFALPRLNVPAGLSIEGFRLRLTGLLA